MKQLNLICRVRIKRYKSYKGEVGKIAPNLLERNFVASKPNEKWVTDVTEFSLFDSKVYLSPILDLYSGDIVSYTICEHPYLSMVTEMLDKAFETISDNTNLILHSDQGWHYQHKQYQKMLVDKGIQQSMSRKGNCLDNAVIENFFGLLKTELLYLQDFDSIEHFKSELEDYLDYYNNRRIKLKLNGLTPAMHRSQASSDIDQKIISMYAKGMTTRQISETIEDIYGFETSEGFISDVTDKILPQIEDWQNRPLDEIYPILYIDAIHYSVRENRIIKSWLHTLFF